MQYLQHPYRQFLLKQGTDINAARVLIPYDITYHITN